MWRYVTVHGTWDWTGVVRGRWYDPHGPLAMLLRECGGVPVVDHDGHPFVWDSGLAGWRWWRRWGGARWADRDLARWRAAAHHLRWFIGAAPGPYEGRLPGSATHIISHSHGAQVVLMACALGLRVQTWIDVAGPIRRDVLDRYGAQARRQIAHWIWVVDSQDPWRILGAVGDGAIGTPARHPLADVTYHIPGIGHTDLLRHPTRWRPVWQTLADTIRRGLEASG